MINFNFLYLSLFCNFAWWNINMPLLSFRFVLYFFSLFALIQYFNEFNTNIFIFFNSPSIAENLSLLPTSLLAQLEEYCEYLLLECAWGLKLFSGSILTGNANYYVISSFLDTMYINQLLTLIINNSVTQDELNRLLFEVQKINYLFNFFNVDSLLYESFGLDKEYFFKGNLSKKNPKPSPSTAFEQIIFFRDLLVPQLFFVEIALFFFKKKIIIFFLTNLFLVIAMLWNLTKLCNSLNLIYALLHFLFFAVLSGIMIILWGSLYIGLCVLLIYGAAIPVLALYIIMLVNVDLIQWLFFFEYISSASLTNKLKTIFFFIFLFLFLFYICANINTFTFAANYSLLEDLERKTIFFFLAKRYVNTLLFTYGITDCYSLPLSFYNSDLDKVAAAAFKVSYNELLALVFLLLIAIIIVISISRSSPKIDRFFYEPAFSKTKKIEKILAFNSKSFIFKTLYLYFIKKFIYIKMLFKSNGARDNAVHDPLYLYVWRANFFDVKQKNLDLYSKLAIHPILTPINNDPWLNWYSAYKLNLLQHNLSNTPKNFKYSNLDWNLKSPENKILHVIFPSAIKATENKITTF